MDREISVTYSEKIIRASVKRQWQNVIGVSGFVLLLVLSALFLYLLVSGDRTWLFGLSTASFIIFGGVVIFGYFRLLGFAMSKFRRMNTPVARFRFNDDGISIVADTGKTEFAWKLIEKILRSPDIWILMVPGGGITLPVEGIDDVLLDFILERAPSIK